RQLKELSQKFGEIFEAEIGSEPIKRMLEEIDLEKLKKELEEKLKDKKVKDRKRLIARLGLVKSFIRKNLRPEWMFLTILPVLPPDLRPMVQLDGGRYATSDLNDLYRRVINRNNRLKKLLELNAPEVIIRNEKRLLQEAVDALIDNSARAGKRPVASSQKRPLRSLTDLLRGKRGRFRQNLLGKRVDYSARSVIVVGPELQIDECGLPKKMALELFKPFVIHKLMEQGIVHNIRTANILIQQAPPEVWKALEEVIEGKYVLLNRAPTLHRLSIQAFKPILIEDLCIRIPPLVCGAFNADFDGDQMAVYLPLSDEAQKEARELMIASRNLLKPATGSSIVHLAQDIILGCYYLTLEKEEEKKEKIKVFADENEVIYALETKSIDLHQKIKVKVKGEIRETTAGRVIFNLLLPEDFPFINQVLRKKEMKKLANDLIYRYGMEEASKVFDKIKEVAFEYATLAGYSWGMDDLVIPKEKKNLIKEAEKETQEIWRAYQEGLLSENERREKVIEVWMKVRDKMRELVPQSLNKEG
ncbi:MAG TPA: DNA-directed RNA polymerase subunit beta', partial [bacterium]|nr:DNA-directed RNA polymerase subunit beta' [bacterium]